MVHGHNTMKQSAYENHNEGPSQKIINTRNEIKARKNEINTKKGIRPLIVGVQAFLQTATEGTLFAIYTLSIKEDCKLISKLFVQY